LESTQQSAVNAAEVCAESAADFAK